MKMYRPHRLCPRNSKPKEPSLYRSLCVSILCMFLSTVMLVGTTMAWFSDSLQTGVFTISSANFSTTVSYCTDLSNANSTPNNWQRLNPSNTTLFGGGSLSSGDGQVAYLKLVNNSNIPLKYTFTLTASEENGNIKDLSLAGCQRTKNGEAEEDLSESDLKTIDLGTVIPNSDSKTTVVFDVPAATGGNTPAIVYAVLKLTYTSSNEATSTNIYNFSLKLKITQDQEDAGVTESNSPTTNTSVDMNITGGTPPTSVAMTPSVAIDSDEVAQQPADENNSGTGETNPTSGPTGEAGTSESGDTGDTGPDAGTPVAGSESESEPNPTT